MPLLLLVEDEPVLRATLARGLGRLDGLEVETAGTFTDAVALIAASPPDLIISDIDLPDGSGLELLTVLTDRGLPIPVVFVTAYLAQYGTQIPTSHQIEVHEKPVALSELREVVRRRVRLEGSEAPPAPFSPLDYVQLAHMSGRSVRVVIDAGQSSGSITVFQGQLWDARDGAGSGEPALRRLGFLSSGRVSASGLEGPPANRTILRDSQEVLIHLARYADELGHLVGDPEAVERETADVPIDESLLHIDTSTSETPRQLEAVELTAPLDAHLFREPRLDPQVSRFNALKEEGLEALLVRDYDGARTAFVAAQEIRPDDPIIRSNLVRLSEITNGVK